MLYVVGGNLDRGVVTRSVIGGDDPIEGNVTAQHPGHLTLKEQILALMKSHNLCHISNTVGSS